MLPTNRNPRVTFVATSEQGCSSLALEQSSPAIKTALITASIVNPFTRNCEKFTARGGYSGTLDVGRPAPDRDTLHASYDVLDVHVLGRFPMWQWRRVFFTDESRFTLFRPDGRLRIYRRRGNASPTRALSRRVDLGRFYYSLGMHFLWCDSG